MIYNLPIPRCFKTLCRVCCVIFFIAACLPRTLAQVPDRIDYGIDHYTRYYHADKLIRRIFSQYDTVELVSRDAGMALLRDIINIGWHADIPRAVFVASERLSVDLVECGEYRRAVDICMQALPIMNHPANLKYHDLMYTQIGMAYRGMGYYDSSLIYFYKSLAALHGIGERQSPSDSSTIYANIGVTLNQVGEYIQAIRTYELALAIAKRKNNNVVSIRMLETIGQTYIIIDSLELAKTYLDKAVALGKGDAYFLIGPLFALGQIADSKKEYDKALDYMQQAWKLDKSDKSYAVNDAGFMAGMGKVYMHMGKYQKAGEMITYASGVVERMHNLYLLQDMKYDMALITAAGKDYNQAYQYITTYALLADSVRRVEAEGAQRIWMNAMLENKNTAAIQQQLRIARQQTQLQQKNVWIGGSILGVLLLLSFTVPMVLNQRHRQALQLAVLEKVKQADEIAQLKSQVQGSEEARRRTAQELYSNVASQLLAVTRSVAGIQQLNDKEARSQHMSQVFTQLSDVAGRVRKTAHSLMPDVLLEQGLATALAFTCAKTTKDTGLNIDYQEYGTMPAIDNEIQLVIYRMAQELLHHAVTRTSNHTPILVQLSCADTLLSITIEDNGKPVDDSNPHTIAMLQRIKERAQVLKGYFNLQSKPALGTTAYLEFDLQYL